MSFIEIGVGIFLAISSLCDWKNKMLSARWLFIGVMCAVVSSSYLLISGNRGGVEIIWALLPGIIILLIAKISKEQIGYGDGIVLLITGSCMRCADVLAVVWIGLLETSIISIFLLLMRKGNKRTRLPFMPFLLIAYIIVTGGMRK